MFRLGKTRDKKSQAHKVRAPARFSAVSTKVNKLFHGVAVHPRDENCCSAVQTLNGKRFLSADAPVLPLTDCANPSGCRCVYERFDERRGSLRREADIGLPARTHAQVIEKRVGLGRRSTDCITDG